MNKKKLLIYIIFILGLLLLIGSSCNPKLCPTYASNQRAKKQLRMEKKGGETGACVFQEHVTKKDRRFANKVWTSNFCKVKPKRRN